MDDRPEGPGDDERFLVVDGRRWRREDPDLPADVRGTLLSHLGRGRSAVGRARRSADDAAVARARRRVDLAKHGLGERGDPWWEQSATARRRRWEHALAELAALDVDEDAAPDDAGSPDGA
ncbi:2-polyprenylphenol hydroxylase [Oryzobacter terrae]|uniref:2-polyprenylphenol hydroxylase n=1 Tax=Oryzobacter terrae TaxID=1620385 RepID=UPI00366F6734